MGSSRRWSRTPRRPGLNEDVVRLISAKKSEPQFMLDWRLRAYRHWRRWSARPASRAGRTSRYPPIDYQKIVYYSAPKQKVAGAPRGRGPRDPPDLREARHPAGRAEAAERGRGGRRVRQRLGGHHIQGEAGRARDHLLLLLGGSAGAPRAGGAVPRLGGPVYRQLLRVAQLGGVQRRIVLLRARRACAARWSCRPTSASTRPGRGSSSGR